MTLSTQISTQARPAVARARFALPSALMLGALLLSGCNTLDRLEAIGKTQEFTPVVNPSEQPNYRPISLPMPQPVATARQPSSLWRVGSRTFFRDIRARTVGDIVTVVVDFRNRSASLGGGLNRSQTDTQGAGLNSAGSLFGLDIQQALGGADPTSLFGTNSNLTSRRNATTNGTDAANQLRLAAVVMQTLPNGNMVIQGRQEFLVNYDMRELLVSGVIRPEDISSGNTIEYDKIAEARIAYGGRGQVKDIAQPRYGTQFMDIILPF